MAKFKTKFDSLVKLRKMKIDEVENKISKMNQQIAQELQVLEKFQEEFSEFEPPQKGSFSLITQFKMMQQTFATQIQQKKQQIDFLKNQKQHLTNNLKEANLEYEKMKYLQGEEIKKYIKTLKEKEQKDMDEIALMLFKKE